MNLPAGIRRLLLPAALVSVGLTVGAGIVVMANNDHGNKEVPVSGVAASASTTTTSLAGAAPMTIATEATTFTTIKARGTTTTRPPTTTTTGSAALTITTTATGSPTTTTTTAKPTTTTTAKPTTTTTVAAPTTTTTAPQQWVRVGVAQGGGNTDASTPFDLKGGQQRVRWDCNDNGSPNFTCNFAVKRADGYTVWSFSTPDTTSGDQTFTLPAGRFYLQGSSYTTKLQFFMQMEELR